MVMRSSFPRRLLLSAYIALGVYCALSVTAGPAGIIAYRELAARKGLMSENLASLREANAALQSELDSLKKDPDRAGREARALGYLGKDEMALVLAGDDPSRGHKRLETGFVRRASSPVPPSDVAIKEISLLSGLAILILGLAADALAKPSGRRSQGQLRPQL
jgi:cell division protein FtsB